MICILLSTLLLQQPNLKIKDLVKVLLNCNPNDYADLSLNSDSIIIKNKMSIDCDCGSNNLCDKCKGEGVINIPEDDKMRIIFEIKGK